MTAFFLTNSTFVSVGIQYPN